MILGIRLTYLLQELEEDKRLQVAQFAEIADKVARCNKIGHDLQEEMKAVRTMQEQFNELLAEKTVSHLLVIPKAIIDDVLQSV